MSLDILVPSPGESITEVEIGQWLKASGDPVEKDEPICEIESEKVTLTVYAEDNGTLEILIEEGETVEVGAVIAKINENGAPSSDTASADESDEAEKIEQTVKTDQGDDSGSGEVVAVTVPSPGESINEVEISQWLKENGDFVEKDEEICEIESEKVSLTLFAEIAGILNIKTAAGETIEVGTVVAEITAAKGVAAKSGTSGQAKIETPTPEQEAKPSRPVESPSPKAAQPKAAPAAISDDYASTLDSAKRVEKREKMSQLRRKLSERLVSVKNETAMLTTFNEVDMSAIKLIRQKYKEPFKKAFDVNLGFMSFFTRAVTIALRDYPAVNSSIDGEEMIFHDYADIGIAVSSPKGLMVPVLRNAERMTFAEIEKNIAMLAEKARTGKITLDEMTGGTFTITNRGIFGSMLSTPILNPPQSGILGMHNIVDRPVAIDGQMDIRPIMYLALSYDHRVIDGRESVGFLVRVKELLEAPEKMLLGMPPVK